MSRGSQQLSLRLAPRTPVKLTAEEERELVQALAELLLAVARSGNDQEREDAHDHQDR